MSMILSPKTPPKKTNYRVRFRHGVFPDAEGQATRADIKKYDYFFAAGQKWVGTEGKLDFVDESRLVAEEFESAASTSEKKLPKQATHLRTAAKISERGFKGSQKQENRLRPRSGTWVDQAAISAKNRTSANASWQSQQRTSPGPGSLSNYSSLDEPSPIDSPSDGPSPRPYPTADISSHAPWPLSDPIEAHLFRFWVEQASTSLDITNSSAVFKEIVPRLAFENPMLMNAIFMISAQSVLRYDPHFPARPYVYHDRILQDLIPYLAERGRIEDEGTLVTAMLLRTFEEFHAGTRGQTHLSTYELFHGPEGWLLDMSRPVVQACLMIHVHAELCQVLLDRPSLQIDYRNCILPALAVPEDDASWGNQILWLSARIMQWTTSSIRTPDERQYLSDLVDEWERKRPAAFDAILYKEALHNTGYFPELWFADPCHADANQHLRIARVALAVSHLDTATAGTHGDEVIASVKDEVLRGLKEIVAIARCNPHCILAPWKAAHAVHKFGVLLMDETARFKMIEFLEEVNAMGIPTAATIEYLVEQWNWRKGAGEWQ